MHEAAISTLFRFDVLSNGALMFCESTSRIRADYRINTGSSFNTLSDFLVIGVYF